jgi:hypothetical protein
MRERRITKITKCLNRFVYFVIFGCFVIPLFAQTSNKERDRAYLQQQFSKNFRDIQLLGQGLLREHESRSLTPKRLRKDSRSINKCARTLRTLMALGDMASKTEINKKLESPNDYDQSIRRLSQLIRDFANNPVHQSNKVFNTDLAERAQTDLLAIIDLSKVIEGKARSYRYIPSSGM